MRASDWLGQTTATLTTASIDSARLDALILLEDYTGHDRAYLLAHPELEVDENALSAAVQRRTGHEPLAYIRGHAEFYGRTFMVNEHVLVPRPESESLIELLKRLAPPQAAIADMGTGSGCLAVTAALEVPDVTVAAVDIDEACLAVAKQNAVMHTAQVQLLHGDMLAPFLQKSCNFTPTVLLANLPYVPVNYPINAAAGHEPALALFAGPDGLDAYRKLFAQLKKLPTAPALIITEALLTQHDALEALAAASGYQLVANEGLAQAFRTIL